MVGIRGRQHPEIAFLVGSMLWVSSGQPLKFIVACGRTGVIDELRCRQELGLTASLKCEKVLPWANPRDSTLLECFHRRRPIHDSLL